MPVPNVHRVAREYQAHSACEVVVGLSSHWLGHEIHVEAGLLRSVIREVMRIAKRIVGSHVASKIQT